MNQNKLKDSLITTGFIFCGFALGLYIPKIFDKDNKTKNYPIEVNCYWSTNSHQSYPTMGADSVKHDTIWKDGIYIINKNIINVGFK